MQVAEAERALEPLLKKAKPDAEALFLMGVIHERRRRLAQAMECAKRSVALHEHPEPLLLLARCHRMVGETEDALQCCDRALAMRPGLLGALVIKGAALEEAGRYDEARRVIEPLVDGAAGRGLDPQVRHEWAKLLVHDKRLDEAVKVLSSPAGEQTEELRRLDLHLLAKARDRQGEHAGAVEAARGANAIGELAFDPDIYESQVSTLIENWSKEAMAKFPLSTCKSELPVFVAGMPRSGTSLIDQIIDAHPKAAGVGELATIERFAAELSMAWDPDKEPPACFGAYDARRWTRTAEQYVREVRRLAPRGAERVVNKALGNNKLVGLIARLFPNTRIIHAIRDPRDVAVSCYMGGFNHALHPWTTRFEWISRAWVESMRMMEHWKASLDVPILDVHYERLVTDPDREFPRIIEFLGLEWDDACRRFHESRRTVRTLSYDQVNRPLYTSSVGRWERYASFMGGVEFPAYEV